MNSLSKCSILLLISWVSLNAEDHDLTKAVELGDKIHGILENSKIGYHAKVQSIEIKGDGTSEVTAIASEAGCIVRFAGKCQIGEHTDGEEPETKPSEKIIKWKWNGGSPLPWFKGQDVMVGTDKTGTVKAVLYDIQEYRALRKNQNGKIEVIVGVDTYDSEEGYLDGGHLIHLIPNYLDLQMIFFSEVIWTPDYGISIFSAHNNFGDEGAEVQPLAFGKAGWKISNVEGARVLPGRDGWRVTAGPMGEPRKAALQLIPPSQLAGPLLEADD